MMLVCVMLCVSGCRDKEQAGIAERTIALAEARLEWEKEQYTIAEEYSSIFELKDRRITSLNETIRLKNQQLESILTSSEAIIKQRDIALAKVDDYRDYKTKVKAYCEEQNTLIKWYQNKVKIYEAKLKAYETINQKYEGPTPRAYK